MSVVNCMYVCIHDSNIEQKKDYIFIQLVLLDFTTVIATELIPTVLFTYVLVIYNILWTRFIGALSAFSLTLACHSKLV